jgi:hypothetical protein
MKRRMHDSSSITRATLPVFAIVARCVSGRVHRGWGIN